MTGNVIADTYAWANAYGGSWATASNWSDTTAGTVASAAPGAVNSVNINGGLSDNFTTIVGIGAAAQLSINNDVLVRGAIVVGGTVTLGVSADLDLDSGASVGAAALAVSNGAFLEVGGSSTLVVTGTASLTAGFLAAVDGSVIQLGALIANNVNQGYGLIPNTLAVDADSSMELGSAGGAALGAITIDSGVAAAVSGAIDGNMVLNGVLGIQALGSLGIDVGDPFGAGQTIAGTGTLALSENSLLTLGVADSAAIRFGGPDGTLALDVLPSGTISGFTAGDIIEIVSASTVMATGLRYNQTSAAAATLTLVKGGMAVGTLKLAGNYSGSLFHLGLDPAGDDFITLQTIGSAPVQPGLIAGTVGYDVLTATAGNQTLTGLGGKDVLSAGGFSGIDFKDTSANLNGSSITSLSASDVIDLTDMNPSTVSVNFQPGTGNAATLVVTDGSHSATIGIAFGSGLPVGSFVTSPDAATGTDIVYTAPSTDFFGWSSPQGGNYTAAVNWQDTTIGNTATLAPSYGNAVTILGGVPFTNITGNGFAANVTTGADVLLWGTVVAGSKLAGVTGALTQTGTLALDGHANLVLDGTASVGGLIEVGGGSTLTAASVYFAASPAALLAFDGSSLRFPTLLGAGGASGGTQYGTSAISVDANSSIEFGSAGNPVAGALTIDTGMTADLAGTISGNVVVNGTLLVAGTLAVAPFGYATPSVSGSGKLELTYGDTLSLAGPDTAAILFSQTAFGGFASTTETLALGSMMPTATISGFAAGDVITVGMIVTNLVWNGTRLTLLNGATTVGSLLLSGVYAANQFQVQPIGNGLSSAITYAATPASTPGNSVSASSDTYTWNATSGGIWSNASAWTDTTTPGTPTAAPGAGNTVLINDNTGSWVHQIIYGPAAAASLNITSVADTILLGSFAIGQQFSVTSYGATSGEVALYGGSSLTAGSLTVTSLLRVVNASVLTVLGPGTFIAGEVAVLSDSAVRFQGGSNQITGTVAVDGTSTAEVGTGNIATSGVLAIDYGQSLTLQGVATIAANVVLNGNLLVYSGTIEGFGGSVGTIGGTGTITIADLGSTGYLVLNASDTAAIAFQGYSLNGVPYLFESLQLRTPQPTGIISGFIAGDSIVIDANVTGASFTQTTASLGTLTLTNGGAVVGSLSFAGNYAASLFQLDVAAQTGVATISLQSATVGANSAAASTNGDAYSWTGASGGNWTAAANWIDASTGTTPVTIPGSANSVTIAGAVGSGRYTTISGNGTAANLTLTGNVLLAGQVAIGGAVNIGSPSGPPATLTLGLFAGLSAAGSIDDFGTYEATNHSTSIINFYAFQAGTLLVTNGSLVQTNAFIGDGSGNVIAIDATSSVRIGYSSGTPGGMLAVAPGYGTEFTGVMYGGVYDNGGLSVAGGATLMIDMNATGAFDPYQNNTFIFGNGQLLLTEGSTLGIGVADYVLINFAGPNATLLLGTLPTASITGFASGDAIKLDQAVTGLTYTQTTSSLATVTLTDGATTVGSLRFNGNYAGANTAFHLDAAPNGDMAVITLQSLLVPALQPTLIAGTAGADYLVATANGQTITGWGGGDLLSGGTYNGVIFKDYSFNFTTIENFATSDKLDIVDMTAGSATVTYAGHTLAVTDGTHSASLGLSFTTIPATGSFHVASDGATGTMLTWS